MQHALASLRSRCAPRRSKGFWIALGGASLAAVPGVSAQLPDIEEVGIHVAAHWSNGVPTPQPLSFEAETRGDDLIAVSVQTPSGATHALTFDVDEWRYCKDGFADLCAVGSDPDIGFGDFVFTFTGPGGVDHVTLAYDPSSPTCATPPHVGYGAPTFPVHLQTGVDLFPTFTWQCAGGPCGNFGWYLEVLDPIGPGASYEVDILTPVATSWAPPGCLSGGTQYMLYLSSGTLLPPGLQFPTTDVQADTFLFAAGYETINQIAFTTRPELGSTYCMTAPNSVGPGARLCAAGSPVAASQDLTLVANGCPDNTPGLFYFGPNQLAGAPFGDGFRCVGVPQSKRMYPFAVAGPMNGNPPGTAVLNADFGSPYAASISAGASLNFQLWYRDGMAMMTGFNLSNALNITFQ